jgi:hypothetical protein
MFVAATGLDYRDFLDALHQQLRFDWYLEIGSQTGRSLAKSRSPSIAVDPIFNFKHDVAGNKAQLHLFQETSDDFFALDRLNSLKIKPNFSFLDGMNLFEYMLRDFMHTEAAGTSNSIIALHDCCPQNHAMTTRDLDNLPRGPWTGDVWKLIPILQEYRPELELKVFDCAPTGLVVLAGLDPTNSVLRKNYRKIVTQYEHLALSEFDEDKFFGSFAFADAQQEVRADFPSFRPAANKYYAAAAAITVQPPPAPRQRPRGEADRLTVHGVDLYYAPGVLQDVAEDLARTIIRPLSRPVDVYVGVHAFNRPIETGRLRVGIQTEQFFDANGKKMWYVPRERFIRRFVTFYDVLLELSHSNGTVYQVLPGELRQKVKFGPHIFPEAPIEPAFQDAPPLFFGSLNDRRSGLLRQLTLRQPVGIAPLWTFGADLEPMIAAHGAVLNLHYVDGLYCEYPRLLKAYLRGKPLVSEPLASPLQVGMHYFDLKTTPTEATTAAVFRNLSEFAVKHSFQAFLESAVARAALQEAS